VNQRVLAERNAKALERLSQAALDLAQALELPPELATLPQPARNLAPEVVALQQREAIATLLERATVEVRARATRRKASSK
jgi:hypothetical protein